MHGGFMKLVTEQITVEELKKMSETMFGELVKAVVDIEKEIMVVDAQMHSDEEEFLLESGSRQENLWGINLHPAKFGTDSFLEFNSMINLRPSQGNRTRNVEDPLIRKKIIEIIAKLVRI
jgi:hypothetical protein